MHAYKRVGTEILHFQMAGECNCWHLENKVIKNAILNMRKVKRYNKMSVYRRKNPRMDTTKYNEMESILLDPHF